MNSPITQDMIVTVGTNGDYQNINDALAYVSDFYPIYKKGGINREIKLLSGFVMAEQILVSGLNLGGVKITAESEITVDASFLTTEFHGFYPLFGVDNGGTLPTIHATFNYVGTSAVNNKHGILAFGAGSSANISGGLKNVHGDAIFAYRTASIDASFADLSGAKEYGAYALRAATIDVGGATVTNAGVAGAYAIGASSINAGSANVSNAGQFGLYASETGLINGASAIADSCGYTGIYSVRNSLLCAHGAIIRNQTVGGACVVCIGGSFVEAFSLITYGSTVPILNIPANTILADGIISQ